MFRSIILSHRPQPTWITFVHKTRLLRLCPPWLLARVQVRLVSDEAGSLPRPLRKRGRPRKSVDETAKSKEASKTSKRGRPRKEEHFANKPNTRNNLKSDKEDNGAAGGLSEVMKEFDNMKLVSEPRFNAGSKHHNDLESFLRYAHREHLDHSSTVFNGTKYEYTVADTLRQFQFDLTRTGRRSDLGIDLIGRWSVPSSAEPLRIFIQCKALSSGLSPSHARELAGAFTGIPAWFRKDILGLVASPGNATPGVMDAIEKSEMPMGFLKISLDGTIEQFHWNRKATEKGLTGMGVTINYEGPDSPTNNDGEYVNKRICLTWGGWPLDAPQGRPSWACNTATASSGDTTAT